jgi:hypothetical protein
MKGEQREKESERRGNGKKDTQERPIRWIVEQNEKVAT